MKKEQQQLEQTKKEIVELLRKKVFIVTPTELVDSILALLKDYRLPCKELTEEEIETAIDEEPGPATPESITAKAQLSPTIGEVLKEVRSE